MDRQHRGERGLRCTEDFRRRRHAGSPEPSPGLADGTRLTWSLPLPTAAPACSPSPEHPPPRTRLSFLVFKEKNIFFPFFGWLGLFFFFPSFNECFPGCVTTECRGCCPFPGWIGKGPEPARRLRRHVRDEPAADAPGKLEGRGLNPPDLGSGSPWRWQHEIRVRLPVPCSALALRNPQSLWPGGKSTFDPLPPRTPPAPRAPPLPRAETGPIEGLCAASWGAGGGGVSPPSPIYQALGEPIWAF